MTWSGQDDAGGSGIATYTVSVSDNGGAFTPWLTATPLTTATFNGRVGHTYAFSVAAMDNVDNQQQVTPSAQTTTQVTSFAPLQLVGPVDSARAFAPTFSWIAVSGADNYDLWVDDLTSGTSQVIRQKALPGTSTTFAPATPLTEGHTYRWYLRAFDGQNHTSPWSNGLSFTVTPVPLLLYPSGPINNLLPTFQWSAVSGASHYDLPADSPPGRCPHYSRNPPLPNW